MKTDLKIAIVLDNYKLEKFKRDLKAAGYTDFKVKAFVGPTSSIKVKVSPEKLEDFKKLVKTMELNFKSSN